MTEHNFEHKSGDTLDQITYRVTVGGIPLDLTNASILVQWRASSGSPVVIEMTVGNGLTITNGPNGEFSVDEQILSVNVPGFYRFEYEIIIGDWVKSWIEGTTLFLEDFTNVGNN